MNNTLKSLLIMVFILTALSAGTVLAATDEHEHQHDHDHDRNREHNHNHDDHNHNRTHEHDHEEQAHDRQQVDAERLIRFPRTTQQRMGLDTHLVTHSPFSERIEVPGEIREAPGERSHLTAPANGIVTAGDYWLRPGRSVQQGEALLNLTLLPDSGMASGLALETIQARERLSVAESNLERLASLASEGVIAQSRVQEARRERNVAKAELEDAQERQRRIGGETGQDPLPLRAPGKGKVTAVRVTPGEVVQAGQRLATIVNTEQLWMVAQLYPADMEQATTLTQPALRRPGAQEWRTLYGSPIWLGAEYAPDSRTLPLAFELSGEAAASMRPGTPVVVSLAAGTQRHATVVPASTLIDDDGVTVAIVQHGRESFERRVVQTGARAQGLVEIRQGLSPGERIVTEGAYAVLLAGRDTDAADHGHSH